MIFVFVYLFVYVFVFVLTCMDLYFYVVKWVFGFCTMSGVCDGCSGDWVIGLSNHIFVFVFACIHICICICLYLYLLVLYLLVFCILYLVFVRWAEYVMDAVVTGLLACQIISMKQHKKRGAPARYLWALSLNYQSSLHHFHHCHQKYVHQKHHDYLCQWSSSLLARQYIVNMRTVIGPVIWNWKWQHIYCM